MNICKYWSAGHITTFFKIADISDDLLHKGSCGAGFNIKRGVITEISLTSATTHQIYFNDQKRHHKDALITIYVINEIEKKINKIIPPLNIKYTFQAPMGAGYGTSAAAALTTAFAINDLLEFKLPEIELWQTAHKAEIENRTGLGDILGLYSNSKFELRIKEGAPGIGIVKSLKLSIEDYDLYTYSLGPLSKKDILTDPKKRLIITNKGQESFDKLSNNATFDNFCSIALDFAKAINLLPQKLWDLLDSLPKSIKASQIMLGESLYFFVPKGEKFPIIENINPIKEELTDSTIQRLI